MRKSISPAIPYALLSLIVMLPLLVPGYVLTLDMIFTPTIGLPGYVSASYPFWAVLHFLNVLVPSQIIEKMLLLAILFLSGFGAHRLLQKLRPLQSEDANRWACYFAGVLYMFNPFVYSRFMAGQYAVLLGYALLPFSVVALWKFCEKPDRLTALIAAAWAVLIGIVSIHTLGFVAILAMTIGLLFAWRNRRDKQWQVGFIKWGGVALLVVLVLSSYWLVPLLFGHGQMAQTISGFGQTDLKAFATGSRGFGLVGNVLGLQGFWDDSKNVFLVPQDVFFWWRVPVILLWLLVVGGVLAGWRRQKGVTIAFLLIILIATVLAVGTAGTFVAPFNAWLAQHVPFFAGYREPQKFVALIVLAYAYFGAIAVGTIVQFLQKHKSALKQHSQTVAFGLCVVPLLSAPLMVWGFHSQLHSAEYPVEWNAINDRLTAECTGSCKVLFLPWHLYMRYSFAGRIIADPAPKFFNSHIVASNDPEVKGATPYSVDATQKAVQETILPDAKAGKSVGDLLLRQSIHYVLLAKENDYQNYDYLNKQKELQKLMDTPTLVLYEVTK